MQKAVRLNFEPPRFLQQLLGDSMIAQIKSVFYLGPLIFAFGFLAPLTAQLIDRIEWTPPLGLSSLSAGMILAAALGIPAQLRGRWV